METWITEQGKYFDKVLLLLIRQYLACYKPKLRGQVTTNVTVRQTSNDCVNRKVFGRCLKAATDGAVMTSVGRLFHTRGAAAPNARSPIVRSRVRCTTSLWVVYDRSRLREMSSSAHCKSLARYSGAVWLRQRNTRTAKRNWMRSGRAASASRTGAAWSDRTYNCCTPVSLPHWARTADDPSDALWCRWVWRCRSRVATEPTRWRPWRVTEEQVGRRSDGCCVCDAKLRNIA